MKMEAKRVLVVEDDSAIRRGLVDALQFSGYEVLQAANGDDGMAQALRATFDLFAGPDSAQSQRL
jgi:DNA-binding response OmpR family regulator